VLIDLDNRIIAPGSKMNQYLAGGPEAAEAVNAAKAFRTGRETGYTLESEDSLVIGIEPVKVLSASAGRNIVVAMAVVSIDGALSTPDAGELGMEYSQALLIAGILAI